MKIHIIFVSFFLVTFILGCSKDDTASSTNVESFTKLAESMAKAIKNTSDIHKTRHNRSTTG